MRRPLESEDALAKDVVRFFARKLRQGDFRDKVEVLDLQQVLMNVTVGRDEKSGQWRYFFGMQQQDIVLYMKDPEDALEIMPLPAEYHWASKAQTKAGLARVPLLVCELKLHRNLTTHHFITYSRIAEQIREVHPYCAYYFLIGGTATRKLLPATILRQAKGFNRVYLDWETEKAVIWRDVEGHLVYLRDRAGIIPNA